MNSTSHHKHFIIKTYGCQMNVYDSQKISDLLREQLQFTPTETYESADLIVFNTCAIREKAAEKLYSDLGRLKHLKRPGSSTPPIIAVGGCVSMEAREEIYRRAPHVDIIFGPQNLHKLPQFYRQAVEQHSRIMELDDNPATTLAKFDYLPQPGIHGPVAYISIMEGCNHFCTYCIVPFTRGPEVSRSLASILQELELLVAQGVKEIYLLGQNVNGYYDAASKTTLATLLQKIAQWPEIVRLRFTTSHPINLDHPLIETFATLPKLASHLHLPLQSGSNPVLKRMGRGYTIEHYQHLAHQLRQARPDLSLSTDLIVGFPEESPQEFTATLKAVEELNFDTSFSFIYSPRPGTRAAQLPDNITLAEKKDRLAQLQNQLNLQARRHAQNTIGTVQEVLLIEQAKKGHYLSGRTSHNRIVNVAAQEKYLGQMVKVRITEALTNSLKGELLAKDPAS